MTQHVIEHGLREDKSRLIALVKTHILTLAKHKFASNVVEGCIQYGTQDERQDLIRTMTSPNDRGESPLQGLIRDQYGNYVVRTYYPNSLLASKLTAVQKRYSRSSKAMNGTDSQILSKIN